MFSTSTVELNVAEKENLDQSKNTLSSANSNEREQEDDIIVLDGEDTGVSDSKRPRQDDDDVMEVDENGITKEQKESVGKIIRTMKRQDLEDLVLAKIVEGIVAHTEVGQLRAKVLEIQQQKDKMASKMGIMMKQVCGILFISFMRDRPRITLRGVGWVGTGTGSSSDLP